MFGRAKKVEITNVKVEQAPTPRDHHRRGEARVSTAGDGRVSRATRIRRSMPIRAYVGPNGHGKSLAAVNDLLPSLGRGRTVLSTVPLLDWRARPEDDPRYRHDPDAGLWVHVDSGVAWSRPLHRHYVRLTEWSQLMEADHCDVFLDEVAGVASSRQHQGMPAAIERLLQKLRKGDITLSWTAPAWARADLILRETTQAVTVCAGYRAVKTDDGDRLWRRNRLFEWHTYDARVYTDWTEGKREKAKQLAFQRFHGPGSAAFAAYDSLGGVDTITSVSDAGRCVSCGGTRRAPACSCVEYVERVEAGRTASRSEARKAGQDGRHHRLDVRPRSAADA